MYITRNITNKIRQSLKKFPVVSVTGPRQSGKTTLLKSAFGEYKYYNLERLDYREMVQSDPIGFLKGAGPKVIFDEAQNLPDLFSYIQVVSDERNTSGQYILSGSQSFLLNEKISQSLAGRVSINHLFPFDINELVGTKINDVYKFILNGFYPRIYDKKIAADDFYPSYLQTYVERDVRTLKSIENLNSFTRFLGLCAGRIGQVLNITSLANDTGISVNTAKAWLSILESSYIIYLLHPYYKNFNKRLIKSPKIYFVDTGIVCSLLKLADIESVKNHYLYGSLFENLVISEIIKYQYHSGKIPSLYYWRESNGTEIDCIIEKSLTEIIALEIKGGSTYSNYFLTNLKKFNSSSSKLNIKKMLFYTGESTSEISGIQVVAWNKFPSMLKDLLN